MPEADGTNSEPADTEPDRECAGLILGSTDATPLEFWLGVGTGHQIELDDLVTVETQSPEGHQSVRFYGIVDSVRKRYEGAQFDSDAFSGRSRNSTG